MAGGTERVEMFEAEASILHFLEHRDGDTLMCPAPRTVSDIEKSLIKVSEINTMIKLMKNGQTYTLVITAVK